MRNSIYGEHLPAMERVMKDLTDQITHIRTELHNKTGIDPVEHCLYRIKSEESMREKCRREGLPETEESALQMIHDAIGVRIVCSFLSDVYTIRDHIIEIPGITVVKEKDYIAHAKPNGYRSYHMILKKGDYYAEIQLRTISMDTWAALEHHMKYKKSLSGNIGLISAELKRCADELASTDVSMQAIRDMIFEDSEGEENV